MPRRIVTLTTDFGTSDHFVGVMKGVIAGICPTAEMIDITHEVHSYEVNDGAFVVEQTFPYFPKKTVHLVVVDPGVGTSRRPILVEAAGQYFIGPDNGVLAPAYNSDKKSKVRVITNQKYFRKNVSRTFHGRDIFAPCAAHLAKGALPSTFGKLIDDYLRVGLEKPHRTGRRIWTGTILKVDHFGNLITNLHAGEFPDLELHPIELKIGTRTVSRVALTFADGADGSDVFLILGSSGYYEVAANQASAAKVLGCSAGAPIELSIY